MTGFAIVLKNLSGAQKGSWMYCTLSSFWHFWKRFIISWHLSLNMDIRGIAHSLAMASYTLWHCVHTFYVFCACVCQASMYVRSCRYLSMCKGCHPIRDAYDKRRGLLLSTAAINTPASSVEARQSMMSVCHPKAQRCGSLFSINIKDFF